jgi:hypothetical protein
MTLHNHMTLRAAKHRRNEKLIFAFICVTAVAAIYWVLTWTIK